MTSLNVKGMKLKRIFGALSASALLGTGLVLFSASNVQAAVSVTATNCNNKNGGVITFVITNVKLNDQLTLDFVNSGGDAAQTVNDSVSASGLAGSTYTGSEQVGLGIWLPMTAGGVVSGLLYVKVNGGASTFATFSVSGCSAMRKVVLEKRVVGGVAPLSSLFKIAFQRNGFDMNLTYPSIGGSYTVPYTPVDAFTVIENHNGGASSNSMYDTVRNLIGTDASHISVPAASGDEHIQIINSFVTRPVSVLKVWKDVNGKILTAAEENKVLTNTLVLRSKTAGGKDYGSGIGCTFISCPFFDVPPSGSLAVVSESDAAGYSLVSALQSVAGCAPQVNVGPNEFPDYQWPACSVTFVNLANAVPPSTTSTTTISATSTSTTSIPTGVTTTTTIPDTTTTVPDPTSTTSMPPATTTTTTTVASTTTLAGTSTSTSTSTTTTTTALLGTSTTKPALDFPSVQPLQPVVFSTVPVAVTPVPTSQSVFVPGTTVARLIVDAAKANEPIPPAPAPAAQPLVETTPAYTGSSPKALLFIAIGFLSSGAALLRIRSRRSR
jgi:hypothetical protein